MLNTTRILGTTLCVISGLSACATVPGETRASPMLKADVSSMIMMIEQASDKGCKQHAIVDTKLISRKEDGTGAERWTVDRCGKLVNYLVTFSPSPRGGTDFGVSQER